VTRSTAARLSVLLLAAGFRESISMVPVAGGTATLVAGEQHACDWIAVDATNVYWARQGSGGLELVERPQ